jgi:hypothetical protein
MIRVVPAGAAGAVARWIIAFHRSTESRWVRFFACGRYKHISAFGYVPQLDQWIFFDWRYSTVDIIVAHGTEATRFINFYTADADLLGMEPRKTGRGFRIGFWCVPAIKQLIGIRGGALRPDALWRDCVRQGAEVLHESARPAADPGRSDASAASSGSPNRHVAGAPEARAI